MAARVIRFRLSSRGRVRYFDLDGPDVLIGRGGAADLSIDHPSITARHARVLVRRGRLILAEMGGLVALGTERLRAATTLRDGEPFRIGDVEASAWAMHEPSLTGRSIGPAVLTGELDPTAVGTRRYEAVVGGRRAEVMVAEPSAFAPHELESWRWRVEKSERIAPELIALGGIDGRSAIAERVPFGIRLTALLESLSNERIQVSREVALAILRRLAETLVAHHDSGSPHAGVVPEAVQLTLDGDVLLLRGGPKPTDPRRNARWCSETRRMNLPPSIADDAFALGRTAEALGVEPAGALPDPEAVRTRGAFAEWVEGLSRLSDRWRIDPSAAHVARVVRLLAEFR